MDIVAQKIQEIRDKLLNRGISATAILGFLTLCCSLSRIWISGWHPIMYLHIGLYLIVLGLAIWRKYLSYFIRAFIITSLLFILGVSLLVGGGFAAFGLLALFCFSVWATILFGNRAGIISCLLCIVVVGTIGVLVRNGVLTFEPTRFLELNSTVLWVTAIFAVAMSAGIVVVILGALNRQVERLACTLEKKNLEIKEKNRMLENDIAERDRMEQERIQLKGKLQLAKKMEAVGQLAGGVAHDLNNTLVSIVSYPELLLMDLPFNCPLCEPLKMIKKTGFKAATIVNDMLTLARRGLPGTDVFDINSVVNEYFKSSEFDQLISFHQNVQIEIQANKDPLNMQGSFFHISKVLMNLVSNAAEAMPEGGRIVITTEKRHVDEKAGSESQISPGDYAVLSLSDTGLGIPKDDLEKIFEPFYTKKKLGRSGTGLGMSVVWNSIKDHNGYITVESTEGMGTTFVVYLPLTSELASVTKYPYAQEEIKGQGESILVVDDVGEQREIAVKLLQRMGYSVHAVGSGEEAIEYLKMNSVDLLILDMIMDPGIDGLETYKKILEIRPRQKAIIASGFSETERVKEALTLGAGAYLRKPFLYSQVGAVVRTELDKKNRKENGDDRRWN
jgi:signal transduction histidine kinase/ActR/RegA family two-component response regulator